MSTSCGIICEYNPFHYGHAYQISKAKQLCHPDVMIGVMSGNFVQRGEPAIIDKWKRAEAAVRNGMDIAFELPFLYSIQAASHFAHGGVHALKLAKCDYISFGSECGSLENLMDIADTSINPDHLREMMSDGTSYPKAYSLLTSSMMPNDILGVSYLKEIRDTQIRPVLIERTGGYLDETISSNASAMAIRKALLEGTDLMGSTPMEDMLHEDNVTMDMFYPYIRTVLLMTPASVLSSYFLFSEGIENHLKANASKCATWKEFLSASITHRYTAARIRRCIATMMMQVNKDQVKEMGEPDTLRVLAFNDTGRAWLHEHKEDIRIASKFSQYPKPWRDMELKATTLYASVLDEEKRNALLKDEIKGARYVRTSD